MPPCVLDVALALLPHEARRAVLHDVGDIALRGLLGADALGHVAGAHVEQFDGDAVLGLEALDDVEMRLRAQERGVEGDLALLLRRRDDVGRHVLIGRTRDADHRGRDSRGNGRHLEESCRTCCPPVSSLVVSSQRTDPPLDHHQLHPAEYDHQRHHHQADHADLFRKPVDPALHQHHRQHFRAGRVEHDRGRQFAHDAEERQHPADRERRPGQRHQNARQRLPEVRAMHARAFLKIEGKLRVGARHHPHRHRRAEREIGEEQRPDRAVDRNRRGQHRETPEEADCQHDAGHHPWQPGDGVDQAPAAPCGAHGDVGDDAAEHHRRGGADQAEHHGVLGRAPEFAVAEHGAIVLERQVVPAVEAEELEERACHKLADRQHRGHEEEQQAERKRRPAPRAELDHARVEALAGDGLETPAAQHRPLPDDQQQHQTHDDEAQCGRRLIVRHRALADGVVDFGGDDLDAGRRAEEQRRLETLDAADEAQHHAAGQHRQQQEQRDPAEGGPARRAAHPACLFERGIHGAEGIDQKQEQERGRVLRHVPDHAAIGKDVDRRGLGTGDRLPGLVDETDLDVAEHAPGHRGEDRRHEEGQRDHHLEHGAIRRIGTGDDPGKKDGDGERWNRLCKGNADRIEQHDQIVRGHDLPGSRRD